MRGPLKDLECNDEAVTFRNGDELEAEADTFAAYLLMPLDDFRRQIPADADPTLDDLSPRPSAIASR